MKFLNEIEKLKQKEEIKKEYQDSLSELKEFYIKLNEGCNQ
jgi:hypothetical protein